MSIESIRDDVVKCFAVYGGLWTSEKIQLKLTEELGELVQALRKKTGTEAFAELGDLLFAAHALAIVHGWNADLALSNAIDKHTASMRNL